MRSLSQVLAVVLATKAELAQTGATEIRVLEKKHFLGASEAMVASDLDPVPKGYRIVRVIPIEGALPAGPPVLVEHQEYNFWKKVGIW